MDKTNVTSTIESLGGSLKVAVLANVHQVTVERWRKRNHIPRKYHEVLGLAPAVRRVATK